MPRETLKNFLEDWKQTLLLHADIKDQLALHNEKGAARDAKKLRKHASKTSTYSSTPSPPELILCACMLAHMCVCVCVCVCVYDIDSMFIGIGRLSALLKAMPSTEKHGSDEMFCIFDWTSFIEEGA